MAERRSHRHRAPKGDFDGDGLTDDFMATGAGWYYTSANKTEWRFLRTAKDRVGSLSFGDFDGDGRTDACRSRNGGVETSWGATSSWVVTTPPTIPPCPIPVPTPLPTPRRGQPPVQEP